MQALTVGIFGVLGVFSRWGIDALFVRYGWAAPLGTLTINTVGSFVAGAVFVLGSQREWVPQTIALAGLVGFCGGLTTFSAYALQSALLAERGEWMLVISYLFLSPVFGLAAAVLGIWVARALA